MDVSACLQEAMTRKGLDMKVAALVRKLSVCTKNMIHYALFHIMTKIYVSYLFLSSSCDLRVGLMDPAISHITSLYRLD